MGGMDGGLYGAGDEAEEAMGGASDEEDEDEDEYDDDDEFHDEEDEDEEALYGTGAAPGPYETYDLDEGTGSARPAPVHVGGSRWRDSPAEMGDEEADEDEDDGEEGEEGDDDDDDDDFLGARQDELIGYRHGLFYGLDDEDDGYDEDDVGSLSQQEVEALVDKFFAARRRAEELESENAKLTQQLMEVTAKEAPETLVIHVSPEMW